MPMYSAIYKKVGSTQDREDVFPAGNAEEAETHARNGETDGWTFVTVRLHVSETRRY